MAKRCKGCIHHRKLQHCSTTLACHYCIDTGMLRGCDRRNAHITAMTGEAEKAFEGAERRNL